MKVGQEESQIRKMRRRGKSRKKKRYEGGRVVDGRRGTRCGRADKEQKEEVGGIVEDKGGGE